MHQEIAWRWQFWTSGKNSSNAASAAAYLHLQQEQRRSRRIPRTERLFYEWKLANSAKFAPKKIFAHVNRNKRMGARIQRPLYLDGSLVTTDQEMADLLKQTFQSVYPTDKVSTAIFHARTEIRMATPHITESETHRALEALNPNKGCGPDVFFSKALKTLSPHKDTTISAFLSFHSKPPRSLAPRYCYPSSKNNGPKPIKAHLSDVCCLQSA